jgi:hypothetical protein
MMEETMKVMSVAELALLTPRELCLLYFQVGKHLVGTRAGPPERLAVERTLANIRRVLASQAPHAAPLPGTLPRQPSGLRGLSYRLEFRARHFHRT